jgi:hypothetical protein
MPTKSVLPANAAPVEETIKKRNSENLMIFMILLWYHKNIATVNAEHRSIIPIFGRL